MLAFALRCCFAEINAAVAPSLWTRMQNNLGQIKPVVVLVCVCVVLFSPCCYLASATVLSSEEKGERSNHGDVSLAARWLVVKGLEGVERLLQTLLCKQNEPD